MLERHFHACRIIPLSHFGWPTEKDVHSFEGLERVEQVWISASVRHREIDPPDMTEGSILHFYLFVLILQRKFFFKHSTGTKDFNGFFSTVCHICLHNIN